VCGMGSRSAIPILLDLVKSCDSDRLGMSAPIWDGTNCTLPAGMRARCDIPTCPFSGNSAGDILLSAAGGRAVNGGGGANFASLPAASNGSLIYCNDCKNVADDAATAGAACVGSGSGALARQEPSLGLQLVADEWR